MSDGTTSRQRGRGDGGPSPGRSAAPTVERLRAEERSAAVVTLARAFHDDPVFNFLVPDPLSQARAALTFMGSVLADALAFGEVWVARSGPTVAAVAGWLPPGAYPRGPRRDAVGVLRDLRSAPRLGRRATAGMRLYRTIDQAHAQISEPHWYLAVLGCDPAWQRRGFGAAVLAPVLERADRDGEPAYLETQKADNVPWYGRHGFDVLDQIHIPRCPTMWAMQRHPR